MPIWKKRRSHPAISRKAAFDCRPVKNREIVEQHLEGGEILLTYPLRMKPWMEQLLGRFRRLSTPQPATRKLQLDELGATAWELIDGKRTVRRIVAEFGRSYRLHPREAEVSVSRFLFELGKRGLIAMRPPDEGGEAVDS
ncbi:MAG: PqqD family protein [Desulfobacterales bacterium]